MSEERSQPYRPTPRPRYLKLMGYEIESVFGYPLVPFTSVAGMSVHREVFH